MNNITRIGFIMENCEEIVYGVDDLSTFTLATTPPKFIKLPEQDVVALRGVDYGEFGINASANHTYNSFGAPSKENGFTRICKRDIAIIKFYYDHGHEEEFFLTEEDEIIITVTDTGDLNILINEDPINPINEPCCCCCD